MKKKERLRRIEWAIISLSMGYKNLEICFNTQCQNPMLLHPHWKDGPIDYNTTAIYDSPKNQMVMMPVSGKAFKKGIK